jgi:hypothetical protein
MISLLPVICSLEKRSVFIFRVFFLLNYSVPYGGTWPRSSPYSVLEHPRMACTLQESNHGLRGGRRAFEQELLEQLVNTWASDNLFYLWTLCSYMYSVQILCVLFLVFFLVTCFLPFFFKVHALQQFLQAAVFTIDTYNKLKTRWCHDDVSPNNGSPNEKSWTFRPSDDAPLVDAAPGHCIPWTCNRTHWSGMSCRKDASSKGHIVQGTQNPGDTKSQTDHPGSHFPGIQHSVPDETEVGGGGGQIQS